MTELTVYDCMHLNVCCGTCVTEGAVHNKRIQNVTYGNILLNNALLCDDCFRSNMEMHEESDQHSLLAAAAHIMAKMKEYHVLPE